MLDSRSAILLGGARGFVWVCKAETTWEWAHGDCCCWGCWPGVNGWEYGFSWQSHWCIWKPLASGCWSVALSKFEGMYLLLIAMLPICKFDFEVSPWCNPALLKLAAHWPVGTTVAQVLHDTSCSDGACLISRSHNPFDHSELFGKWSLQQHAKDDATVV